MIIGVDFELQNKMFRFFFFFPVKRGLSGGLKIGEGTFAIVPGVPYFKRNERDESQ